MEKLLHERLRDESSRWYEAVELHALADEIERTYAPLPRYEDGETVRFGKEVEGCNGNVKALLLFNDGSGQVYGAKDDPWEPCDGAPFGGGDVLKRPTPKVYDADGAEINVGDYGYGLIEVFDDRDDMLKVEKIEGEYIVVSRANGGARTVPLDCAQFTHERPVFDTEGVRICKGDTVWLVKEGYRCSVTDVLENGCIDVAMFFDGESHRGEGCAPELFTHREPDSLEKLRDFASEWSHPDNVSNSSAGDFRDAMQEVSDRLTALIERCA